MIWTFLQDAETEQTGDDGVEGNSRLTATSGAVIFVLLAVEGITVLSVRSLLRLHAFMGMALVPPVLLKTATTTYRAARYYLSAPPYRRRGPPRAVLRILGPLVVVLTVAVLGTGVALLLLGPGHRSPWFQLHEASFIVWFVVMTVHVLGHIVETARVAPRDWTRRSRRVRGTALRRATLVITLIAGFALGLLIQPSVGDWLAG